MVWLLLVVALFGPALALLVGMHVRAILQTVRSAVGGALLRAARRLGLRRPPPPEPAPVDRLVADLHRLAVHLAQVEQAQAPAKMARLRAASLAYDEVLVSACRALELPVPGPSPLRPLERLEAEAVLAQHGLDW